MASEEHPEIMISETRECKLNTLMVAYNNLLNISYINLCASKINMKCFIGVKFILHDNVFIFFVYIF